MKILKIILANNIMLLLLFQILPVLLSAQVNPTTVSPTIVTPADKIKVPGPAGVLKEPIWLWKDDAPKVIILMHGITGPDARNGSPNGQIQPYLVNTLEFVKDYFGYHFCLRMLGRGGTLNTNPLTPVSTANYPSIHKINSNTQVTSPAQFYTTNNTESDTSNYIYTGVVDNVYIMLIPRDGRKKMIDQAIDAVDKIYNCYRKLPPTTNIYFVCHSGGGIVTRMIMTPDISLRGTIVNKAMGSLQIDQVKANFIRKRTVGVVTLSTPHDGSPLPTKVTAMRNNNQAVSNLNNKLRSAFSWWPVQIDLMTKVFDKLPEMNPRDSRDDMSLASVLAFNQGALKPELMAREDGTLIPFYTFGGRCSTGKFFNNLSQNIFGGLPPYVIDQNNPTINLAKPFDTIQVIYGIMMAHWALHAINVPMQDQAFGWGTIPAGATDKFDKKKWGSKNSNGSLVTANYNVALPATSAILPPLYTVDGTDGEVDTDGFVSYASAMGYFMGTSQAEYFDHNGTYTYVDRKTNANKTGNGCFYRFYDDGTKDWENNNHGTIMRDPELGDFVYATILRSAGPFPKANTTVGSWTK